MTLITLQNIKKDFGIKEILRDGSFSIEENDKVGLIGVNGSGKSTLLKAIAGIETFDSGTVTVKSGANIVYLPQQPNLNEDNTVLDEVFNDSSEKLRLVRKYEEISQKIESELPATEKEQMTNKLTRVMEKMEKMDAWELETKAKIILSKLGIKDFETKVGSLSGGYRKRISLATALLEEPDLLLMDEPTNHLDAESVEWLQNYLDSFGGAILLITHDRYFLDKVTNRILEIDRADLYTYSGNYSYFLGKKAEQEAADAKIQHKHRGILRRELEWLKRGPKARSTKQQARIDRIHEMQDQEFKEAQGKVAIDTVGRRIGKKVIELHNISKAYDNRTLIKDFSYEFTPGDRIGIIGGNGAGKSTLMNIITGKIEPDSGHVEIGKTIHIGYFDQHSEDLLDAIDVNQRVIDYIKDIAAYVTTSDGGQISASQMLERFLFNPNQQYSPIHKLSGGEKRRLFLLQVLMGAPNVLILDEPTNDLDVQTLSVLEDYLESFNGCVISVSHDRYFLDRTVEFIFAIEPGGNLRLYPGNYSVYLDSKKAQEKEVKAQETSIKKQAAPAKIKQEKTENKSRRLSNYEKREYEKLESKIAEMEMEKEELEKSLYHNPPNDFTKVQELSEKLSALNEEIDIATERWMELAERDS
ncbi:ATPase component of ABC transporters with duplicated ATPase domain [Xenococcus sp. PCC 7305]|uniref:ABC transporter ATP-binding protein n=1 Tax=Xenococcus sp. PCC 7305 TaxID=102125 RepID=UPI0002ABBCB3|nr:ABC-F family ATP-binding cassette domain-containing protein [Xenococcus sp. PCC 7305]ELS03432.1 ATPase component of ABC transporters with duplicated ATPase domain [Xenococcus sp. PCC 7305]